MFIINAERLRCGSVNKQITIIINIDAVITTTTSTSQQAICNNLMAI